MAAITAVKPTNDRLINDLNREWLVLSERTVPAALATSPALADCATLGDALDRLFALEGDDLDQAYLDVLEAYIRGGCDLAGRLMLQRMLGRAVYVAHRAYLSRGRGAITVGRNGNASFSDLLTSAVAALWRVIATYPIERRRARVGANIAMDTLMYFNREDDNGLDANPIDLTETLEDVHAPHNSAEIVDVLAWGVEVGIIRHADADLLARVYCPQPGECDGGEAVAVELGISYTALRARCSRAIKRLAAAVREGRYVAQ
ncbi:hypothetical protein [Jiangella rhizosphaerae]|uniref:Sigma-70 family RNA polymerase sigma factor n=1 Tax=Jiangella rhizosphaerae TaxID=2293569 RepID=A0A418KHW4_9ACTN|nr:hypothetical protein [Jiangella rhizosphaerae]RIQ12217.1 hypothetical protein DY240_27375 [Jiangella rhizosphaerae]